jgi:uncharacterized membrane-anchored protein
LARFLLINRENEMNIDVEISNAIEDTIVRDSLKFHALVVEDKDIAEALKKSLKYYCSAKEYAEFERELQNSEIGV